MLQTLTDMLANFGAQQLILIWIVVVFSAVLRAFTGFGFALAAVPAFSLLMAPTPPCIWGIIWAIDFSSATARTCIAV
jgi:hypothetical protein